MNQFKLLTQARFGPLFFTQFLGALNDNVYKNALVLWITFQGAQSANAALVTLAAGLFILPFLLFSASAGQFADKYDKAALIVRIKGAEIAIMALGAVGFLLENVWWLLGILFLMGSQSAAFGPLKYGILPQHLERSQLTGGNGMIQMATYLAILVGTIVGGVLITLPRVGVYLLSATVLVLAISGWLASRRIPAAPACDPGLAIKANFLAQLGAGMRHCKDHPKVFVAIIGISWFWFVGATFLQLLPAYTRETLSGGPHVVTFLLAAFSIGIGCGSLLCERLSRGEIELALVPAGAVGMSLCALGPWAMALQGVPDGPLLGLAAFLAQGEHWLLGLSFTGLAFAGGIYIVPLYALMQVCSAPARRSRVVAANNIINALFMVTSALLCLALLKAGVSIAAIFALVAVGNAAVCVWLLYSLPEFSKRLRQRLDLAG